MLRWQEVADSLKSRLLHADGREIAPGVVMHFSSEAVGGFPFNVDAVLTDVTLDVNCTHGRLAWRADHFAIHELTFGRTQEIFEAAGRQELSWTDTRGLAHRFTFVPGSLRASAIASGGRLVRFDLDIDGISSGDLWGARTQLHLRQASDHDAIDVALSAEALHLSPVLQAGFESYIDHLRIAGTLSHAAVFSRLRAGHDEWRTALEKWRKSNGTLRLDQIEIRFGKIAAVGNGNLGIDPMHRPNGILALRIAGAKILSSAGTAESPFAGALAGLTTVTPMRADPMRALVAIHDGRVNVAAAGVAHTELPAGSVEPFY